MRSILSNMGDAVVVADKDNNFLVFNPAAERMFGKGAMESRQPSGRNITDYICRTRSPRFRTISCPSHARFVVRKSTTLRCSYDMKRRPTASGRESLVARCVAPTVIC
jgi:PAS domain S-box